MRCTTSLGIVLLSVTLAFAGLMNVAGAAEKTTLFSLVKRLLDPDKSQPDEQQIEPTVARSPAQLPRYRRPALASQPAERRQQSVPNTQVRRLPEAQVNSLPLPPPPPTVRQAWVHPPRHQPKRGYSTEQVFALTRNPETATSSRRGFQARPSRGSAPETTNFDLTRSSAFARRDLPLQTVSHVNHVTGTSVRADKSLPPESLSVGEFSAERKPVGNTPAEVRNPVYEAPQEIESPPQAKPMKIARASEVVLPASTLPPVFHKVRGRIDAIDIKTGVVHVNLSEEESLPAGTKIKVYHETSSGEAVTVDLRVLQSVAGRATAQLIDGASSDSIRLGDKTTAWKRDTDE